MDAREIEQRRRWAALLALAVGDMQQARAAARELKDSFHRPNDQLPGDLIRALETAMSVCYARSFVQTRGGTTLPKRYWPTAREERVLHDELIDWRHRVHAHSSDETRRAGSVTAGYDPEAGIGGAQMTTYSQGFDPRKLDEVIEHCTALAERFNREALILIAEIDAPEMAKALRGSETDPS